MGFRIQGLRLCAFRLEGKVSKSFFPKLEMAKGFGFGSVFQAERVRCEGLGCRVREWQSALTSQEIASLHQWFQ